MARTVIAGRVAGRAQHTVVVARHAASHRRRYMFYRGPKLVIPNDVLASVFHRPLLRRPMARPVTVAAALAGWTTRARGIAAIAALPQVLQRVPDTRPMLFGRSHVEDVPTQQCTHRSKEDIEFTGQVSHRELLRHLGSQLDALVHPAREKSHGMALFEMMAQHVSMIAGRHSGCVPSTLDKSRDGLLMDVTNPVEIHPAMPGLAENAGRRDDSDAKSHRPTPQRLHVSVVPGASQVQCDELELIDR